MTIAPIDRFVRRRGTVLPLLAVSLTALFAFVALAIDLGMLAVSRTECQNAADAAALAGCRTLNNNSTNNNSNLAAAVQAARTVATSNYDMAADYTSTQVQEIDAGQYLYNTSTQSFSVYNGSGTAGWTNVTAGQTAAPSSGSWTAMQVTISYTQPMYFLTVLGVTSMPTGAVAAAVHRPRDIAFVLDMTASMAYASQFNYNYMSNNPDTMVPRFGHYVSTRGNCIQNTNQTTYDGEAITQNNYCIYTPDGKPIIRDFVYDPANINNPATPAYPITSNTSSLMNAFHRWGGSLANSISGNYPPEAGASNDAYLGPVYNFAGYNAFDTTGTSGPTPAPDSFIDQLDSNGITTITYVGDRYPRQDGKVWTTATSWSSNSAGYPYPLNNPTPSWTDSTSGATTSNLDYLGVSSPPTPPNGSSVSSYNSNWSNFRDPAWETYGYDLMMGPATTNSTYRALRNNQTSSTNGTPIDPSFSNIPSSMCFSYPNSFSYPNNSGQFTIQGKALAYPSGPTANCFKGYSMGPGYWGKTFYIWPPDPRFSPLLSSSANLPTPNKFCPAFDNSGNAMCDWRRHFFLDANGNPFNPQTTNINNALFNTTSGATLSGNGTFTVNYPAILAWIKSGPQVLPPNLRAGRIVFYSSIPNDVNTSTASGQAQLDKVFWQNYIDYVLGNNWYNYIAQSVLYGNADPLSTGVSIDSTPPSAIQYPWEKTAGIAASAPYMNYSDSPLRPRLHFWFGPLSMVNFISGMATGANWNPGTVHEAQCWQLKVAMNSVIADLQTNHPNDYIGMAMFSAAANNGPRIGTSQNYTALQNALFYPYSLLSAINGGDTTTEECPYTTSFGNSLIANEIPNAQGTTDPNTGLAYAFNLLCASNQLSTNLYSTTGSLGFGSARRGASKMVILETDGVPNTYRSTSSGTSGMITTNLGYDTYYATSTYSSGDIGDGNSQAMTYAYNVVQQMVATMTTSGQSAGSTATSGLSLPNAPCYVYPIAFGDIFDANISPNATFRPTALQFLANIAAYGNTGTSGATTLPSGQIIIGDYNTRINTLQNCLQGIFQNGVTVTLIE